MSCLQFIPCSLPSSRGTDPYGCTVLPNPIHMPTDDPSMRPSMPIVQDSIVTGKAWLLRNRALCTASASRSFPPVMNQGSDRAIDVCILRSAQSMLACSVCDSVCLSLHLSVDTSFFAAALACHRHRRLWDCRETTRGHPNPNPNPHCASMSAHLNPRHPEQCRFVYITESHSTIYQDNAGG